MLNGIIIDEDGNIGYYENDILHREGGPAIECKNGEKYYYKYGKTHRIDGPAIIWYNPYEEGWYLDGVRYKNFYLWLENNHYLTKDQKMLMKLSYIGEEND